MLQALNLVLDPFLLLMDLSVSLCYQCCAVIQCRVITGCLSVQFSGAGSSLDASEFGHDAQSFVGPNIGVFSDELILRSKHFTKWDTHSINQSNTHSMNEWVSQLFSPTLCVTLCVCVCSSLEKKTLLRDNVDLLVSLADVYFRAGDTKNAILKFEQAQMLDAYLIKGGQNSVLCVGQQSLTFFIPQQKHFL